MFFQPRNFWDPKKKSLISFKVKDCGNMCFSMLDFAGMNVESVGHMFETPWNHYIVSRFGNVRLKSAIFIRFTNIYLAIPWLLSKQTTVRTARRHPPSTMVTIRWNGPSFTSKKKPRPLLFWNRSKLRNGVSRVFRKVFGIDMVFSELNARKCCLWLRLKHVDLFACFLTTLGPQVEKTPKHLDRCKAAFIQHTCVTWTRPQGCLLFTTISRWHVKYHMSGSPSKIPTYQGPGWCFNWNDSWATRPPCKLIGNQHL